jgi:VWFA-related protein
MSHNDGIVKIAAALLALTLSAPAFAQQPVTETIEVRVTNIDVIVTDRAGNPIPGLTKEDFEIIESGKPQTITNFYEVRGEAAAAPGTPAAQAPGTPSTAEATTAAPTSATRRRILVYVDGTSVHPHARTQMLETFERSLDQLMRPGDQAVLLFFSGSQSEVLTPLTSDRAVLVEKLRQTAKKSGGSFANDALKNSILDNAQLLYDTSRKVDRGADPSEQQQQPGTPGSSPGRRGADGNILTVEQAYSMARSAAHSFAEQLYLREKSLIGDIERSIDSLAGAEGKKVLIFIGGDLAENPGVEIFQRIDAIFAPQLSNVHPVATRDASRTLTTDLLRLAHHANAADVTMYTVDASSTLGVDASNARMERTTIEPFSSGETTRAMANVAHLTGGISVPGGKTFQTALNTISRDLSAYYSLGYRSSAKGGGGMEVRVKKPGVRVRYRRTFDVPAPSAAPAVQAVAASITSGGASQAAMDEHVREQLVANVYEDAVAPGDFQVTLSASSAQPQPDGRKRVVVTVSFPSNVKLVEEAGALKGQVAVFIATANEDGDVSKVSSDVQNMKFPLDDRERVQAQQTFTYSAPLLVGSGEITVSVAVADQLAGTTGFAKTVLNVP